MSALIERSLAAQRESKRIEFKEEFSGSKRSWCELLKDVFALSNSGGGIILFGVNNSGNPTGSELGSILNLDPADFTNKVLSYTGYNFSEFEIFQAEKNGVKVACLLIDAASCLLVPNRPGTYPEDDGKQGRAFSVGVVYMRHGAKSAPSTIKDLADYVERQLREERKLLLGQLQKVVRSSSKRKRQSGEVVVTTDPEATAVRLTENEDAPEYRLVDPDTTHPYRLMELVTRVNERLPDEHQINSHDPQAIRSVYDIDDQPTYTYKPAHGSRIYSQQFADWIVSKFEQDRYFFRRTRAANRRKRRLGPLYHASIGLDQ